METAHILMDLRSPRVIFRNWAIVTGKFKRRQNHAFLPWRIGFDEEIPVKNLFLFCVLMFPSSSIYRILPYVTKARLLGSYNYLCAGIECDLQFKSYGWHFA